MSNKTTLSLWMATDQEYVFQVLTQDESEAVDISGYELSWMLKADPLLDEDTDAVVTKTVTGGGIVVAGTYNSDPDVNTQRATVTVEAADLVASPALTPGIYFWELKRIDTGFETVLGYGPMTVRRGVHWA